MIQIDREITTGTQESRPDVLLLETREELCKLLKLYLERLGFRALCAGSSEEALKLWVDNKKTLSMFLSDWSQTRGLTPRDLVALFRMGKPSVRFIDTAPFVNFTSPPHEFAGQRKTVAAPRSLEAFSAILLEKAASANARCSGCREHPSEEIVVTN